MTASFLMYGLAILALGIGLKIGVIAGPTQIWVSRLMMVGGFGGFLLGFFPTDIAGQSGAPAVAGASERLLIGVIFIWILIVVLRLRKVACGPQHFQELGKRVVVR